MPLMGSVIPNREAKSLFLTDHHEQSLGTGDSSENQIALKQHVMLHCHRNHDWWKFRTLRPVNGHRLGQRDFIKLTEVIRHQPVVELD
jgi:undecaprenyl pyrophosphate synthase